MSQGSGKKKRKRRRNKKRNKNDESDNHQQQQISRAGSNEALMSGEEKPVVLTTYVCSSSELDKVRRLATEKNTNDLAQPDATELQVIGPINNAFIYFGLTFGWL